MLRTLNFLTGEGFSEKACSCNRFDGGCFDHMTMRQIGNIAAVSCAGRKEVSFLVAFSQTHVLFRCALLVRFAVDFTFSRIANVGLKLGTKC